MDKVTRYCIDCVNYIEDKPLPRCEASRYHDLVTGKPKRTCLVERLDGVGRCGGSGNNFTLDKPKPKKKPGPKPKDGAK